MVIQQVCEEDPIKQRAEAAAFAERLHRALLPQLGDDLSVTHGRPGQGAAGVAAGYHEARLAMSLARQTAKRPDVRPGGSAPGASPGVRVAIWIAVVILAVAAGAAAAYYLLTAL